MKVTIGNRQALKEFIKSFIGRVSTNKIEKIEEQDYQDYFRFIYVQYDRINNKRLLKSPASRISKNEEYYPLQFTISTTRIGNIGELIYFTSLEEDQQNSLEMLRQALSPLVDDSENISIINHESFPDRKTFTIAIR